MIEAGYLVHTVKRPANTFIAATGHYRRTEHDLFGLWDHVAVHQVTGEVIFVQTKSRKLYGKDLEPFKAFPAPNKFLYSYSKVKSRWQLTITKL